MFRARTQGRIQSNMPQFASGSRGGRKSSAAAPYSDPRDDGAHYQAPSAAGPAVNVNDAYYENNAIVGSHTHESSTDDVYEPTDNADGTGAGVPAGTSVANRRGNGPISGPVSGPPDGQQRHGRSSVSIDNRYVVSQVSRAVLKLAILHHLTIWCGLRVVISSFHPIYRVLINGIVSIG